jgi:hypothetical protein
MVNGFSTLLSQSTIMICQFLRLSNVKILPKVAKQKRKSLSKATTLPNAPPREMRAIMERANLKPSSLGGDPIKHVFTILSQSDGIQPKNEVKNSNSQSCTTLTN